MTNDQKINIIILAIANIEAEKLISKQCSGMCYHVKQALMTLGMADISLLSTESLSMIHEIKAEADKDIQANTDNRFWYNRHNFEARINLLNRVLNNLKKPRIIGISGEKQHGKDTLCNILMYLSFVKATGSSLTFSDAMGIARGHMEGGAWAKWERRAFSDKLKDVAAILLSCDRSLLDDNNYKESILPEEWWYYKKSDGVMLPYLSYKDTKAWVHSMLIKPTVRNFLQLLGTECGCNIIHPNIWLNPIFDEFDNTPGMHMILTDVRYVGINTRNEPYEVNEIHNRGGIIIRIVRNIRASGDTHRSEVALKDYNGFDYTIQNDDTVDDLVQKIRDSEIMDLL